MQRREAIQVWPKSCSRRGLLSTTKPTPVGAWWNEHRLAYGNLQFFEWIIKISHEFLIICCSALRSHSTSLDCREWPSFGRQIITGSSSLHRSEKSVGPMPQVITMLRANAHNAPLVILHARAHAMFWMHSVSWYLGCVKWIRSEHYECLFTSLASLSHKFCFGIISPPRTAGPKQEPWFENDDFGYLRRWNQSKFVRLLKKTKWKRQAKTLLQDILQRSKWNRWKRSKCEVSAMCRFLRKNLRNVVDDWTMTRPWFIMIHDRSADLSPSVRRASPPSKNGIWRLENEVVVWCCSTLSESTLTCSLLLYSILLTTLPSTLRCSTLSAALPSKKKTLLWAPFMWLFFETFVTPKSLSTKLPFDNNRSSSEASHLCTRRLGKAMQVWPNFCCQQELT